MVMIEWQPYDHTFRRIDHMDLGYGYQIFYETCIYYYYYHHHGNKQAKESIMPWNSNEIDSLFWCQ